MKPGFSCENIDWEEDAPPTHIGFASTISVPGVLHIVHNASNEVLESMPNVSAAVDRLALVAKMLHDRATCLRLCHTCFTSAAARHHHHALMSFHGMVYRARWGTVAFCVKGLLSLEAVLKLGWSMKAYLAATASACGGVVGTEARRHILEIDIALTDEYW